MNKVSEIGGSFLTRHLGEGGVMKSHARFPPTFEDRSQTPGTRQFSPVSQPIFLQNQSSPERHARDDRMPLVLRRL